MLPTRKSWSVRFPVQPRRLLAPRPTGGRKLDETVLGKRDRLNVSYDEVIQGSYVDECQGL